MQSSRHGNGRRIDSVLDVTGKTLIATGLLLLAFVAYQLWGTGISESRAQNKLAQQFNNITTTTVVSTPVATQPPVAPKKGDIIGRIKIPTLDVSKWLVAGVGYEQLEKGPGLFSGSPLPGQLGNVALAGHRTTYGAPFGRINELKDGDQILIDTSYGSYVYIVNSAPKIVSANAVQVVKTTDRTVASLTLVSCHPKWTSKQRIIVTATLQKQETASPATEFQTDESDTEVLNEGWFHDLSTLPQTLGLVLLLIGIWVGAFIIERRGRSKWAVYPITLMIFLPVLFVFFGYLTHLLPTNL